ncbi:3-oxo-tetronate 4-phosphate decarboxylase [Candidatus Symbiopectobacterium sp. NZEC135]|uniref:3-oxo-tetronate 4-phosphate decarboxylase n=1 Tax=Candidatus Symbiopectobacterium sp. NZEC135 TaxID=2820471 RepID=UPI0022278BB1|nr:3-oxo-tetronate 4-phosphate decarboxylase [Candidatus Symbiopectobacterium sp. NZEC135]
MERELREQMVSCGASYYQRGYSVGSAGNLSLRLPDGHILATPTNSCLGSLQAERLSKVTMAGEQVTGDRMSKEIAFHLAIYRQRPDCNAIVHLHSTYLTALSCLDGLDPENIIRPFTPYYVMKVGKMPLLPYFKPGSIRIAETLAQHAHEANAFLLANHGPVVLGTSLTEAVNAMDELEETAKLMFLLKDSNVRYLTEAEVSELRP